MKNQSLVFRTSATSGNVSGHSRINFIQTEKVSAVSPAQSVTIAVAQESGVQQKRASILAQKLQLPVANITQPDYQFLLVITDKRLELRRTGTKTLGPIYVDFTTGAIDYRRKFGGGRKQPLARAVGLKGNLNPTLFDATAGLGRDGFVLACLGCRVHLFERSPVIGALLEDGLRRAMADSKIGDLVRERISLSIGDSTELLKTLGEEKPDVIYLDPMYPHRLKSALVKKEMRILRAIVGDDRDAPLLLDSALKFAQKRVVVKRPILAPAIEGPKPGLIIKNKNSRYDVYLIAPANK